VRSGGGSFGHIGVHVGGDWWLHLNTYEDHSPILDIDAGSTSVSVCFDGPQVTTSAVEFARELAEKAVKFAAEVERLHARQSGGDQTADGGAGNGQAA
jgi:hypothetical protein